MNRFFSVFIFFPFFTHSIFQLNNGGDKKPAAVLSNNINNKNGTTKTNIYKRTFYESIYLGDLKPAFHSETAKAFQTNDWQDILLNGHKIFEHMDGENVGDLEDLIKKYHVCQYVIRLTIALAESEKCSDFQEFMRMLEFVAKYIDDEKNGIAHTHATVKHHVSFDKSANIIIPSSARPSMTTQSINLKPDEELVDTHTNFLCFPCHLDCCDILNCCKSSTSPSNTGKDFSDTMMDSGVYLRQDNNGTTQENPSNSLDEEDETTDNNTEELETTTKMSNDDDNRTTQYCSADPGGTD